MTRRVSIIEDDVVVDAIVEHLRERGAAVSIEGLQRRYGPEIVLAAMRRHSREQRRELVALRRQEKRAHAEWEKRHSHYGVRYAGEVHLTRKGKIIKLRIFECPRCATGGSNDQAR
jgi:hypothetical protein